MECNAGRTCFSSYPELRIIGGSKRLKNKVCLNVWMKVSQSGWHPTVTTAIANSFIDALGMNALTSISLIIVPGASLTINPTNMPANMDTMVSLTARIRLICK